MSEPIPCILARASVGKKEILLMSHTEPNEMRVVGFSVVVREDGKDTLDFTDASSRKARARFNQLSSGVSG